jgi:hypothetical protein
MERGFFPFAGVGQFIRRVGRGGVFHFFLFVRRNGRGGVFLFCFIRSPAWGSFVGVFGVGRFSFSDIFVVIGNDRTQIRKFRLFILSYFGFTHKQFCRN